MHEGDAFRLLDPDEAVALGCFLILIAVLTADAAAAERQTVFETQRQLKRLTHPIQCDATMRLSVAGVVLHDGCYIRSAQ